MKRVRVYADTSVIGGCLDEEFAEPSRALLEMVRQGEVALVMSDLLLDEIRRAPSEVVAILDSLPPANVELTTASSEALRLRDRYLAEGIVGSGSKDDALHVALATLARVDLIVSWNFRHIVHYDKIRKYNAVNLLEGYPTVEIRTPEEFV